VGGRRHRVGVFRLLSGATLVVPLLFSGGASPALAHPRSAGGQPSTPGQLATIRRADAVPYGASAITFCGISAQYIDIWSMGTDGSNPQPSVGGGCDHAWSPDGTKLAWEYEATDNIYPYAGLFIQNSDGSNLTFLGIGDRPTWAPDGQHVAALGCEAKGGNSCGSTGLSVWNADGTNRRDISTGAVTMADDGFGWTSPDTVAFVGAEQHGAQAGIYTMSTSGGSPSLLPGSTTYDPSWVAAPPDGRRLAFVGHTGPADQPSKWGPTLIYLMSSHGGNATPLTSTSQGGQGYGNEVAWSPDGKSLIYSSLGCKTTADPDCLKIVPAAGGTPVEISQNLPKNLNPQVPQFEPAIAQPACSGGAASPRVVGYLSSGLDRGSAPVARGTIRIGRRTGTPRTRPAHPLKSGLRPASTPSPLQVSVAASPSKVFIEQDAAGAEPETVTVCVTVTNVGSTNLYDVGVDRTLGIGVLDQNYAPSCIPPAEQSGDPTPWTIRTLDAGQSAVVTYKLRVTGDGTIRVDDLAAAVDNSTGQIFKAVGSTTITATTRLLYWSAEMGRSVKSANAEGLISAGTTWTIRLHMQDRSCTKSIVLDYRHLYPKTMIGNAADGHVQIDGLPIEQIDENSIGSSQYELFAPRQTKTLEMIVHTYESDARFIPGLVPGATTHGGGTRSVVELPDMWAGWVIKDDGTDVERQLTADDQAHPGDQPLVFTQHVDDKPIVAADLTKADRAWIVSGEVSWAVAAAAGDLLWGGLTSIPQQFAETESSVLNGLNEIALYEIWIWQGLDQDPSLKQAFLDTVKPDAEQVFSQVSKISALYHPVQAWNAFQQQLYNHYSTLQQDIYAGDYDQAIHALANEWAPPVVGAVTLGLPLSLGAAKLVRWKGVAEALQVAMNTREARILEAIGPALEQLTRPLDAKRLLQTWAPKNLGALTGSLYRKLAPLFVFGQDEARINEALAFAEKNNVVITIRSRAMEALKWLARGAALKAEQMKIKTVDALDIIWLGYRSDNKATVIVRKLPTWEQVEAKLSLNGVRLDSEEYQAVRERWLQRTAEWDQPANNKWGDPRDMIQWNNEGEVTLQWNWQDNKITAPNEKQTVGFRLVDTTTGEPLPPGAEPKAGVDYAAEVCQNGVGVPCPRGQTTGWRRVAGDTDMVSIVNPDASNLTEAQHQELLLKLRQSGLGIMHPELATWTKTSDVGEGSFFFKSKQEQLEGGPFLQLCPDGSVRIVQYVPGFTNMTKSTANANNYFIHFLGGCEIPLSPSG